MTPRVVGLDLSLTATGVALADGTTRTITTNLRGVERLRFLRDTLLHFTWPQGEVTGGHRDPNPDLVVIEDYAFSRVNQAAHIGELGGVVRLAVHLTGVPWVAIAPTAVKKYATGKGNANKDAMRDAARDRFGMAPGVSSDECDAAWLRAMGLDHLGHPPVALPAVNRAALDKVAWPS